MGTDSIKMTTLVTNTTKIVVTGRSMPLLHVEQFDKEISVILTDQQAEQLARALLDHTKDRMKWVKTENIVP